MLACQVTPKDNDITLKGQQDVLTFIVVESGNNKLKQKLRNLTKCKLEKD